MDFTKRVLLGVCFVALLTAAARVKARTAEDAGRKEIEAFNKRYVELHLKMDTAGGFGLWGGGGGDLVPGGAAGVGGKKKFGLGGGNFAERPGMKSVIQRMGVCRYACL